MNEDLLTPIHPQEPIRPYRPHILNLLAPLLWAVLMLLPPVLILIALNGMGIADTPLAEAAEWWFIGLYLVFVLSYFMMQIIFWYQDAWLITSTGLLDIQLISLFNRRVAQLHWNQVQDVRVTIQGFLASLFGFGDITVQSAGRQGMFELRSIPRAREVADLINQLSTASQRTSITGTASLVPTQRLGELLVQQGSITGNELTLALQEQRQTGKRLGQILVEHKFISREDLVKSLGSQYHLPSIDLSRYELDHNVATLMPYETAVKYHAIPIHHSADNVLSVAISQPSAEKLGELMEQFDLPLTFLVADEAYIQEAITDQYLDTKSAPSEFGSPQSPPDSFGGENLDNGNSE